MNMAPASPDNESPVDIFVSPELPVEDEPVPIAMSPLFPESVAAPLFMEIDPLTVEPCPLNKRIDPPVEISLPPALIAISLPPRIVSPVLTTTEPEAPALLDPVEINILPESPPVARPVDKEILPLLIPSAVFKTISPPF